jgi:S-methylmethionine-dependent homocysteine/selenocysteine methylase
MEINMVEVCVIFFVYEFNIFVTRSRASACSDRIFSTTFFIQGYSIQDGSRVNCSSLLSRIFRQNHCLKMICTIEVNCPKPS